MKLIGRSHPSHMMMLTFITFLGAEVSISAYATAEQPTVAADETRDKASRESNGQSRADLPHGTGDQLTPPRPERRDRRAGRGRPQPYSIEQATSDQAQLHTIAFSGLAFITGDFGAATFLPPGKVCDFFGFQYMRDIDAGEKGHNPMFLDRCAGNVLRVLTAEQRASVEALAREQAPRFQELAEKRWPLIKAFYTQLKGHAPTGHQALNQQAVIRYVGNLFVVDAELGCRRAQVLGQIAASFTPPQKAYLAGMKFGDFNTWPDVDLDAYKLPRGTDKLINVAYMTYASELFSWYAGSLEADVYFCPERHGTYFGGFFMKDMPAMGKRDYDISTSVTGDSGRDFLNLLTEQQRTNLTAVPDQQRKVLKEVVTVRRAIATELRRFLRGEQADSAKVLALGRRYGELDGELSYRYVTAFAQVNRTLTAKQRAACLKLRNLDGYASAPAYLYSTPVRSAPAFAEIPGFFDATKTDRSAE